MLLIGTSGGNNLHIRDIYQTMRSRGSFGGTIPLKESIRLGRAHEFVSITKGRIEISEFSRIQLLPLCDDEVPNIFVLRLMLSPIILAGDYTWLAYLETDIQAFIYMIPQNWVQILQTANLLDLEDEDVIDWWIHLLRGYQEISEGHLTKIGDFGESLTIDYETQRLQTDGFEINPFNLNWVSQISDAPGYDVKTVRGNLYKEGSLSTGNIQIEVKSTIRDNPTNFTFHLSRNQFNVASESPNSYFIHCWFGINIDSKTHTQGPFSIPFTHLIDRFPVDRESSISWSKCKIELDVSPYRIF